METEKLKGLTINKLNEYPVISISEQMAMKGGVGYGGMIEWALRGIGGVASALGIYDYLKEAFSKQDSIPKKGNLPTPEEFNKALDGLIRSDSTIVTFNSQTKEYSLKIYGGEYARP